MICGICKEERKESLIVAGHGGSSFKMEGCNHRVVYRQVEATQWFNEKGEEVQDEIN